MEERREETSRAVRWTLFSLLAISLVAALAWAVHRQGGDLGEALDSMHRASEDVATTARVKTALALSKRVSAFDVRVDSRAGTVSLRGVVPSAEVRELAGRVAATISGVREVRNSLVVDPETLPDPEVERMAARVADLEIETAIQEALYADPEIREGALEIAVEGGAVELRGGVPSTVERYRAEVVTRSIPGVQSVENRLEVSELVPADPDRRLARAVEFELYSTRAFDLEPIAITASGDAVTLSGTVRSRAEKLLAARVAAETDGVERVIDDLEVADGRDARKVPRPTPRQRPAPGERNATGDAADGRG